MKKEDKELLLKDLCARLPYGVKGNYQNSDDELLRNVTITHKYLQPNGMVMTGDIKPYLFPLSSMTEEQKIKCFEGTDIELDENFEIWSKISSDTYTIMTNMNNWLKVINWLLKNHFDIYGLIPMGLAIDATGLNIY